MPGLRIFLILAGIFNQVFSQLVAVRTNAILPVPRRFHTAAFDGQNSIYIIGGSSLAIGIYITDILKYSISMDTITVVAELPNGSDSGSMVRDGATGNLFNTSGWSYPYFEKDIFKFDPNTGDISEVAQLPTANYDPAAVQREDGKVVILSGYQDPTGIVHFNPVSLETERVGNLSRRLFRPAAFSDGHGSAFVFGSSSITNSSLTSVLKLNLSTLEETIGPETFPILKGDFEAVWDGRFAYLIGGLEGSSETRNDAIVQFDHVNMEHVVHPVVDFPVLGNFTLQSTASVYIPGLNRIYIFGGQSQSLVGLPVIYSGVWYINLDTINGNQNSQME